MILFKYILITLNKLNLNYEANKKIQTYQTEYDSITFYVNKHKQQIELF